MRFLSTQQQALYTQGDFVLHTRVLVDSTGLLNWVDMSAYMGRNWIHSVTYSDAVDQPMLTGKVSLQKDVFQLSTSPFRYNSKLNQGQALLAVGRRLRIYVAATPVDLPPAEADYRMVADAVIEEIDAAGWACELTIRDFIGSVVQNCYIRAQTTYGGAYGGDTGTPVAVVMQNIINDNINTPNGLTLTLAVNNTPSPPAFLVNAYIQSKQTVQEALNNLAQQIGWLVKPLYDPAADAFVLTLFQPLRDNATPVWTFSEDNYTEITAIGTSRAGVRNIIAGTYQDASLGIRNTVTVSDTASIAKYGPPALYMELTEEASSGIGTQAQMLTMLNAILADLKEPQATFNAKMFGIWWCEVGDVYQFLANTRQMDTAVTLAVSGFTATITSEEAVTDLTMRGKPTGGYRRWLRLEGRVGVATTNNVLDPASPDSLTASPGIGSLDVYVPAPKEIDNWFTTEIYMSLTPLPNQAMINGKYQKPSSAFFATAGRQVRFSFTGLLVGTFYYIQACYVDRDQNVSAVTQTVQQATEAYGPYHQNTAGRNDNILPNNDFNIFTKGRTLPPDRWTLGASLTSAISGNDITTASWGTGNQQVYWTDTPNQTQTGNLALAFKVARVSGKFGAGAVRSAEVPITVQGLYRVSLVAALKPLSVPANNTGTLFIMTYGVELLDADKNVLTTVLAYLYLQNATDTTQPPVWKTMGKTFAVSSTHRYIRAIAFPQEFVLYNGTTPGNTTNAVAFTAYLDKLSVSTAFANLNLASPTVTNGRSAMPVTGYTPMPIWKPGETAVSKTYIGFRVDDGNVGADVNGAYIRCYVSGEYSISARINISYAPGGGTLTGMNTQLFAVNAEGTSRVLATVYYTDPAVIQKGTQDANYSQFYQLPFDLNNIVLDVGTTLYFKTDITYSQSTGITPTAIYSNARPCTVTFAQSFKDQ